MIGSTSALLSMHHKTIMNDNHKNEHHCGRTSLSGNLPNILTYDRYGWIVVFASFIVHLVADGCAFSFGVFYVELLNYFKVSKGITALVGSLFVSIPLITGPIASAITNHFGCRFTTIIGGFIAGTSFVISSLANSIEMLCFTFGVLAAIGLSMAYVPAIVVVAFYFEDNRAFATGIAVAGSGIGTFIFAPLTEFLIEKYTWRGALLIIGGLMYHIMVAGTAFRPLHSPLIQAASEILVPQFNHFYYEQELQIPLCIKDNNDDELLRIFEYDNLILYKLLEKPIAQSLMQLPTFLKSKLNFICRDQLLEICKDGKTLAAMLKEHGLLEKVIVYQSASNDLVTQEAVMCSCPDKCNTSFDYLINDCNNTGTENVDHLTRKKDHLKKQSVCQILPFTRKDIFYRGSLIKTRKSNRKSVSCPNIILNKQDDLHSATSENMNSLNFVALCKEIAKVLFEMMDVTILNHCCFLYFCFSSFLLYSAYDVPYIFTPDKAIKMGISESKASFLLSIMGITSTVGQIFIGWLGDVPEINSVYLYNVLTALAGAVTMIVPWLWNYRLLCAFAAAFGILISANYALTTIILVQLVGMDNLTNAYGIVMLFQGLANLFGPPVAGLLSDRTGEYDLTFIVFGGIILLSGLMLFALHISRCAEGLSAFISSSSKNKSQTSE